MSYTFCCIINKDEVSILKKRLPNNYSCPSTNSLAKNDLVS